MPNQHKRSQCVWFIAEGEHIDSCYSQGYLHFKSYKWLCPGFELGLLIPFSRTTTIIMSWEHVRFQTFFVQAFKTAVDSWKFSMLLLYILWDDWPIFMISGSNKQLQQQLEYTLLKPAYHSWWISKIQSGREDTLKERYAIKFCFKLGKNATETYGMLQTAFQPSCMNRASVFEWHKTFKEGRESVRDDERCGRSKEVRTPELIGQIKNFMDKDRRVSI